MAINLSDNIQVNLGKPVDNKYLQPILNRPYTGVSEVNSTIIGALRYSGLTVNVGGVEYWYKDGVGDGDLVLKTTGAGGGSGERIEKSVNQTSHGFSLGEAIAYSGGSYISALADGSQDAEIIGLVTNIIGLNQFVVTFAGYVSGLTSVGLSANTTYFVSDLNAGQLTPTEPTTDGSISKPIIIMIDSDEGLVFQYRGVVITTGISQQNVRKVEFATITPTTLDSTSDFVGASGATTINLPPIPIIGQQITISDVIGNAGSSSVTVNGNGNNIDSGSSGTINTNYGSVTIVYEGNIWKVISIY